MQIRFQDISKRFGKTLAVDSLNFTIESGSLHFLLGPSGCGKTTTLRMLAGLDKPTSGQLYFGDRDVTQLEAASRNIGMVFQNYALWPHMTVLKNITYGLKLRNLAAAEQKKRVEEVLDITRLDTFVDRYPSQLSGGQQQRVALARALAIRPDVLLLDEPLSNLDAKLRVEMRINISRIHKQTGITTVYVTHDQKEALSMGTGVSVMRAGKLIQNGTPRALYRSPVDAFIAGFVGETNLINGKVQSLLDDGSMKVSTSLGTLFVAKGLTAFKVGEETTLSFRPECVLLAESDSASPNILDTKLDHAVYFGKNDQLMLSCNGYNFKANYMDLDGRDWVDGESLKVRVDPRHIVPLHFTSDLSSGT